MSVEEQFRTIRQLLEQLAYISTQLSNTLVSRVVESSPQLYMKTKLRLLSAIGSLPQEVMEIQQAWEEMNYEWKRAGLGNSLEENDSQTKNKASKRPVSEAADNKPAKRGRKKKDTSAILEESIRDLGPFVAFPDSP